MPKVRKEAAQQTLDEQEWSGSLKARQERKERKKLQSISLAGSLSQKHTYLHASHKSLQPEMLAYLEGGAVAGRAGATDELCEHELLDLFLQDGLFARFCMIQGHSALQKGSRRTTMDQTEWFALLSHVGLLPHVARYSSTCQQLTKAQAAHCFALAADSSGEVDAQQYLTAVDRAMSILCPSALAQDSAAALSQSVRVGNFGDVEEGREPGSLADEMHCRERERERENAERVGGSDGGRERDTSPWAGFDFNGGEAPRSLHTPRTHTHTQTHNTHAFACAEPKRERERA